MTAYLLEFKFGTILRNADDTGDLPEPLSGRNVIIAGVLFLNLADFSAGMAYIEWTELRN